MSATTHSAAVKRLLHVAVQPLIAEVWFPLLLRGPSPASPAPPGSPGRTRRAPERTRRRRDALQLPAARPPALPRATRSPLGRAKSARGGRCHSRVGEESKREPERAPARCIPAANRWYLPSYTFPIIASEPWCKRDARTPTTFLLLPGSWTDKRGRFLKRPADGAL